jgi:5-bromo-4-chloroindolyl phosphate hydrolysis protein
MSNGKVSLEVVPVSGAATNRQVEIKGSGVSMKEFLKEAGLSDKNMNLWVDGESADLRTHVAVGAKVKLTEKAKGS